MKFIITKVRRKVEKEKPMIKRVNSQLKQLWNDESGQGMLEYVLLAVAIVIVLVQFKSKLGSWFQTTSGAIDSNVGNITNGQ